MHLMIGSKVKVILASSKYYLKFGSVVDIVVRGKKHFFQVAFDMGRQGSFKEADLVKV